MVERRQHRRLAIRLPIECLPAEGSRDGALRATTANISTGGVYFEVELPADGEAPAPGSMVNVDLTIPPGDGHFPYEGRISSTAEVLRCEWLFTQANGSVHAASGRRVGVAGRFREPLKLDF